MTLSKHLLFECHPCGARFEAAGRADEWKDPIYGPCREYHADCPSCGQPAKEYRPKGSAQHTAPGPCGTSTCGSGPCGGGVCPIQ